MWRLFSFVYRWLENISSFYTCMFLCLQSIIFSYETAFESVSLRYEMIGLSLWQDLEILVAILPRGRIANYSSFYPLNDDDT